MKGLIDYLRSQIDALKQHVESIHEKMTQGGFLIAKIHQISGRIFAKILKENNITINPSQGRILFVLWREDKISIQELAKRTSLGKSTLTSMLDRLENSGFLIRVPSKTDRRKILIKLTQREKNIQKKYNLVSDEMKNIFYQGFSPMEINEFEKCLKKILENLIEFENKART